jgi:hypothetical protein
MKAMKSIAQKSYDLTSLFEAEVLVRLMLRRWEHPYAEDDDFANHLLENASLALREALEGKQVIETLPAESLNFIAAIWYAERCAIEDGGNDTDTLAARNAWLASVRRALPSCFCDPSDLPPGGK